MTRFMPELYVFIIGVISGFVFRAYLLVVLSVLILLGGFLFGVADGQGALGGFWSGLILMAIYQLAYLLGAIADALLRHD
ncbi:hypothetical protein [Ancylobacter oerskovii]|uniref:hypothetical protein n=1 Tax=Ancylobacter oerskovii TaxID=459519 RepID=UPI001BCBED83|nr:hypothetical protein [Ancylobacter oerskovii]MBS7542941.1 hypothetical protein [Ancylobacter oerskovii]